MMIGTSTLPLTCRICHANGIHAEFAVKEMMYGTREEFRYFQCAKCGCLQINEIPKDMSSYYPEDYYSFQVGNDAADNFSVVGRTLRKWLVRQHLFNTGYKQAKIARRIVSPPKAIASVDNLLRHCSVRSLSASFLDVGCGAQSWWLKDLHSVGFNNLVGVDPFIGTDRKYDGISIKCGSINDINDHFDVISMHHSLEHVPDQVATMSAARERLKPGGYFIVRVPLVSSDVWEKYTTNWVELDAPRHFYLHSLESLKLTGEKAGLLLEHHFCDALPFEFWGSEQYARGITLRSENSFSVNPDQSDFTFKEMALFKRSAAVANEQGRGGRGVFFFRAKQ